MTMEPTNDRDSIPMCCDATAALVQRSGESLRCPVCQVWHHPKPVLVASYRRYGAEPGDCEACPVARATHLETGALVECVCGREFPSPERAALLPEPPTDDELARTAEACVDETGHVDPFALAAALATPMHGAVQSERPYRRSSRPSAAPDARISVVHEPDLKSTPRFTRPSTDTSDPVAELREVMRELRPDRSGPFGWPIDGTPPKHAEFIGALASRIRVDGGGGGDASVPVGAFASVASVTAGTEARGRIEALHTAVLAEPRATLLWLQTCGTLAHGHAVLYRLCGKHFATEAEREAWGNAEQQREEALCLGRERVTLAVDVWRGRYGEVRCGACGGSGDAGEGAACAPCEGRGFVAGRLDTDEAPAAGPQRTHIDAATMARSVENQSRRTGEAIARASARLSRPT